jgi:hypothetical protein
MNVRFLKTLMGGWAIKPYLRKRVTPFLPSGIQDHPCQKVTLW